MHSNLSDGTNTPEEIVDLAAKAGMTTIALTDHDIVDGIERAQKKGAERGVEVIPGIEFTCEVPKNEVHILGYYIDRNNPELQETLKKVQEDRVSRVYRIIEKLKGLGVNLDPEEVFKLSGKKVPGRPHVARALIAKGFVADFKEAFSKYLDFRAPAYVSHYKLTPVEAIRLIKQAGGIAVFAHPGLSNYDEKIPELAAAGLRGLEACYPGYQMNGNERRYRKLADKLGLLITGGTDFHGENAGRDLKIGDVSVPDEILQRLKDEHIRGN